MSRASPGAIPFYGAFLLLTLIWGTTWAVIRIGLEGLPPLTGVALRFVLAGAILLAVAPLLGVRFSWSRREVLLWLANGTLAFSVSYSVVYWAEQYIPSGLAAVLFATYPLFLALLAHVALPAERLSARAGGGVLLGFLGVAIIFSDDLRALGGETVRAVAGVFLLSPLVSAVATVVVKRWGAGIHPLSLAAVPMLLTGLLVGGLALVFEGQKALVFDARSLGALLYLAVVGSAVTFTIYYWLLARAPATRVGLLAYTIPIVAVAVGAAAFKEPVRARLLAGGAVVLAGVAIVNRARRA
ncbi:MAG TPA: DMT family transporter [Vicinamibacteria bacterium]|nr:DMT family transporter [Vicinamibacteria bacterium]